jgi:HEPN domain-containing protein
VKDYENAGFHAQQAAEKFIKALLVRHQIEFPKTHSIALRRQRVAQADQTLAESLAPADALTPYGVKFRYPGDLVSLTHEQGVEAHQLAEQARDLIISPSTFVSGGRETS